MDWIWSIAFDLLLCLIWYNIGYQRREAQMLGDYADTMGRSIEGDKTIIRALETRQGSILVTQRPEWVERVSLTDKPIYQN